MLLPLYNVGAIIATCEHGASAVREIAFRCCFSGYFLIHWYVLLSKCIRKCYPHDSEHDTWRLTHLLLTLSAWIGNWELLVKPSWRPPARTFLFLSRQSKRQWWTICGTASRWSSLITWCSTPSGYYPPCIGIISFLHQDHAFGAGRESTLETPKPEYESATWYRWYSGKNEVRCKCNAKETLLLLS